MAAQSAIEKTQREILTIYELAEGFVTKYFPQEIEWCDQRPPFQDVSEQDFLREYAWVVLCSGFRFEVIDKKWEEILEAFYWFEPELIWSNHDQARAKALTIFKHIRKITAILTMAGRLAKDGFNSIRTPILTFNAKKRLEFLESLPYIGKVTRYHLARNLGFDYIKPDRHILRLAERFGVTPFELGQTIHQATGKRIGTIDVILWRYMEQEEGRKIPKNRSLDDFIGKKEEGEF